MNFRNCFVEIPEGNEFLKNDATYVKVRNGNFSIKLKTFCTPKIAKIFLQGIEQGEFVLEPGVSYEAIERNVNNYERFAVYDYDTPEASEMGKDGYTKDELGLVEVRFYEVNRKVQPLVTYKPLPYVWPDTWTEPNPWWTTTPEFNPWWTTYKITCDSNTKANISRSCSSICYLTSVIGTEGKSDQYFGSSDKYEIDYSKEPIILYLRLVPEKDKVRPLTKVNGCRSAYPNPL